MGNNSATMTQAKTNKADEFYTTYEDIEKEMINYKNQFKDKVIYCNCDDYKTSNFVKYFQDNFHELGLKEVIATSYNPDGNGTYYSYNGALGYPSELEYNGDFRGLEFLGIMLRSDIIITNPPFSLFRDYIEMLMKWKKQFIILGNVNGATCKDIFHYFQEQKMWFGPSISSGDRKFYIPDDYPLEARGCGVDEDGKRYIKVKGVRWFTNLKTDIDKPFLVLTEKYTPEKYPKYDNYNAINVNKIKDIPMDYKGIMGVPITFLDKHCLNQFDILGIDRYIEDNPNYGKRFTINGKELYARILIKRK